MVELGMAKPFPIPKIISLRVVVASSPAWFEMCSWELWEAEVLFLLNVLSFCDFPGFLVPCAKGNSIKKWDELWVNYQGKGALPWPHPGLEKWHTVFIKCYIWNYFWGKTRCYSRNRENRDSLIEERPGIITAQSVMGQNTPRRGEGWNFGRVDDNKASFAGGDVGTKLVAGGRGAAVPNLAWQMCEVMSRRNCHKSCWRGIAQWCRLMSGFIKAQFGAGGTSSLFHVPLPRQPLIKEFLINTFGAKIRNAE